MNKIILFSIIAILYSANLHAVEKKKCNELEGFKKIGKDSIEYINCLTNKIKNKKKFKLNTDSKITDLITGKEKLKIPNPITGLKKIGNALKPDIKSFQKK